MRKLPDNRFLNNATESQILAIEALEKVVSENSSIEDVFAYVSEKILSKRRNERLSKAKTACQRGTARWLRNGRCSNEEIMHGMLKGLDLDHTTYWKDKKTGKRVIITEPYQINTDDLLRIADIVRKENLQVMITADSAYFPGVTVCVKYELNELEPKP